jgi:hypothetical protein
MWKAFCRGALPPRRFACGLQCARSATFPDVKSCRRTLHIPGIIHEEGMRSWVDMAIRSSLRNPFREPCGYIATLRSKVHLELNELAPTLTLSWGIRGAQGRF